MPSIFRTAAIAAATLLQITRADLLHSELGPELAGKNETGHAASASAAAINCGNLVPRLNRADCQHMSDIGIIDQGVNSLGSNGRAWIGNDGPYTFTFHNQATKPSPVPVTLILWLFENDKDYQAMFVNARRPYISVSLPNIGDSVTISLAANQIGGFAALNAQVSVLNPYGQVSNTWGEFNTKPNGNTFDVSREVDMNGNFMDIRANNGCVADMNTCVFACTNGKRSCYEAGTYAISNCGPPNPGAQMSQDRMNGGCSGWGNSGRGHLDVNLRSY